MKPDPGDSRLISARVLDARRVSEMFYPRGLRQGRHRHDSAALSFVVSGKYDECVGRQPHSRTPMTLVFHPAGETHAVEFSTDVRILSVEFRRGQAKTAESLTRSSSHRSELIAWLGSRLVREMARVDSASSLAMDGLISEMLAEGSRGRVLSAENGNASWLARATDFVHDNFTTPLSLDDVAQVAGVHSAHLSRVFRQKMRCTVGEYVRRLRFEFACQQILSTEMRLCEVAHEAGFADQSHFNRLFRTQMGITPYAYRRLHRT